MFLLFSGKEVYCGPSAGRHHPWPATDINGLKMNPQQIDSGIHVIIKLGEEVKFCRIRRYQLLNVSNWISHNGNLLDRSFKTVYLHIKIVKPLTVLTFR